MKQTYRENLNDKEEHPVQCALTYRGFFSKMKSSKRKVRVVYEI